MRLYEEYPEIYDKLYTDLKDYEWEADRIRTVLPEDTEQVVSFGCGTGLHDRHLVDDYEVTGVDLTPSMLDVARQNNPSGSYQEGNIRDVSLDKRFDAAICLFTVINYMASVEGLREAVRNMASHLKPEGVLVIDYNDITQGFDPGVLHIDTVEEPGLRVTRSGVSRELDSGRLEIEFHVTVAKNQEITTFKDIHRLTNFSEEEYRRAFREAGLEPELVGEEWPLWVVTNPE